MPEYPDYVDPTTFDLPRRIPAGLPFSSEDEIKGNEFLETARSMVKGYIRGQQRPIPEAIYVTWFAKTLQNWKACVSTTDPDGTYYEVTHNGDRAETYLDVYVKADNLVIPDNPQPTIDTSGIWPDN